MGYSDKVLTYSPSVYWRLNDASGAVAEDSSGNSLDAAYTDVALANAAGPDGVVLAPLFDGTTSFVNAYSAGLNSAWNGNQLSMQIWFKPSSAGVWTDGAVRLLFIFLVDANNYYYLTKTVGSNSVQLWTKAGGTSHILSTAAIAAKDDWNCFHITVDKANDRLLWYFNGHQLGVATTGLGTFAGNLSSTRCYIGSNTGTPTEVWDGWLSDVALWFGTVLTPAQVYDLATASGDTATQTGTRLADMPKGINQHGFEACNGKLYAIGGRAAAGHSAKTYEYDPDTDAWTEKTDLPYDNQSPVLRTVNNKLYYIGGYKSGDTQYDYVYEFDPAENTWTQKTSMPTTREDMGSAEVDGIIYVFGGIGSGTQKEHAAYNVAADTWDDTVADLPENKVLGDFGVAYDGKVYAIGAEDAYPDQYPTITPTGNSYVYDPATDEWSAIADMPLPRCYKECVVLGDKIYIGPGATGNTETLFTDTIYSYHPQTDTWELVMTAPFAGLGAGLAVLNNQIYLSGGYFDRDYKPYLFRLDEIYLTQPGSATLTDAAVGGATVTDAAIGGATVSDG